MCIENNTSLHIGDRLHILDLLAASARNRTYGMHPSLTSSTLNNRKCISLALKGEIKKVHMYGHRNVDTKKQGYGIR